MSNKKRKFLWLDPWKIEEQETWFQEMSLQGWELSEINSWFAIFEKSKPSKTRYRCDIGNCKNEHAGWDYVGSRKLLHIYREKENENPNELYNDPKEQALALSILKKDLIVRGMITIVLSFLLVIVSFLMLRIDPVANFLDDTIIQVIVIGVAYLFISSKMIQGMIHISRLVKKRKAQISNWHDINYKKSINRNRLIGVIVNAILLLWLFSVFINLFSLTGERFPDISKEPLPVVQFSDVMDESEYELTSNGDLSNYYKVNSSILVPKQFELKQRAKVPGVMWEDDSGQYKPSLSSFGYQLWNKALAKLYLQQLKDKNTFYDETFHYVTASDFDELWVYRGDNVKSAFIARIDRHVYYVEYYGMEPIDSFIERTLEKGIH